MINALLLALACTAPDSSEPQDTQVLDTAPEELPRRELPDGVDDAFSQQACSLFEEEGEPMLIAGSEAEAGQALIVPSGDTLVHRLELPESGPGYLTVEVPEWMSTIRFFADEQATYSIDHVDAEELTGIRRAGACPDTEIHDNRYAFHAWGSYVLRFDEDSPREIWFVALIES